MFDQLDIIAVLGNGYLTGPYAAAGDDAAAVGAIPEPVGAVVAAVPEPASTALLAFGLLLLVSLARHKIAMRWRRRLRFPGCCLVVGLWVSTSWADIKNWQTGEIVPTAVPGAQRQPGDADMDWDFDQLDLVRVQIAAKYLTGQPATWGEGDWNGAPGGCQGYPPPGNGLFDQMDVIAALTNYHVHGGPYAAMVTGGTQYDQASAMVGSLTGSGGLGDVDLVYVPEPSVIVLAAMGVVGLLAYSRHRPCTMVVTLIPLLLLLSTRRQAPADLLYDFSDGWLPAEIHGGCGKLTDGVLTLEGPGGVVWSYIGGYRDLDVRISATIIDPSGSYELGVGARDQSPRDTGSYWASYDFATSDFRIGKNSSSVSANNRREVLNSRTLGLEPLARRIH